jgi:hypothetical protein
MMNDPFEPCETLAELFVLTHHLIGIDGVEKLLTEAKPTKESLREAADEIARVGMVELARVVRLHARRAKPGPPTFDQRWPPPRGQKTLANMRARGYRI